MPHPHRHNLTALVAVTEFALARELPLDDIALPTSPHGRDDVILVNIPWGEEPFARWTAALAVEIHDDATHTPGADLELRALDSFAVPGTVYEQAKLTASLPTTGVRVMVVAHWRFPAPVATASTQEA